MTAGLPDGFEILFDAAAIAARVDAVAAEIAATAPRELHAIPLLFGAFVFAADLMRALERRGVAMTSDVMRLASYHGAERPVGPVQILRDVELPVAGRSVLLIDDIADTGDTLARAQSSLRLQGAASIRTAVLLDKSARRRTPVTLDHVGFHCPDRFVIGYGMDAEGRYRGLPFIAVKR